VTKQTDKQIPPPPNDGRTYKYVGGKHVAIGEKQKPVQPASERRAKAEAEAAAKAEAEQADNAAANADQEKAKAAKTAKR